MDTAQIHKEYSAKLFRFISSRVKDPAISKDLLQETFVSVHLKIESLLDENKLKSWLFSIANNTINDYYRKNKKSNQALEIDDEKLAEEETKDKHSFQDCLLPHIKNLPPLYKEAVYLSDIKGLKQTAVAARLGISISGAKSRIQRGRKLIQEGYMNCCDYKMDDKGYLVGEHKEQSACKVCH